MGASISRQCAFLSTGICRLGVAYYELSTGSLLHWVWSCYLVASVESVSPPTTIDEGSAGYVAPYDALKDIYDFVQ